MEELQRKLQLSVDGMMDKLEKERLRPIQKATYLKMAACYDNKSGSQNEVEHCVQNCSAPTQRIHQFIQAEMNNFQDRISRCSQSCQDEVKDKFGHSENSAAAQEAATRMFVSCANSCVDKNIALLKSIQGNIEREIDSVKKYL